MADKKKILVVDDHFEMLEFLRSMLELSNPDYQILAVPSAEEGLLELKRTAFDLLISDVRLPGMSGFELVRKVRQLLPQLPVLMITAYASMQGRQEADQLGVYRYFEKPLDTDTLLAAVHATLYTRAAPAAAPDARSVEASPSRSDVAPHTLRNESTVSPPQTNPVVQLEVTRRLQVLLSDTGAVQALLANSRGQILFRAGTRGGQPVERLAQQLSRSLADSFKLAAELKSPEPFTIQYQAGERVDLYTANIGRHYFLILLFDARARRGRIGTVWIFAQRAIKELRTMLSKLYSKPDPGHAVAAVQEVAVEPPTAAARPNEPAPKRASSTSPVQRKTAQPESGALSDATRIDTGDLFDLLERTQDVDLDAFWEEATAGVGNRGMHGLSFDEAVQRGLLPPDLSADG